jgi:galactonate dehydratase
MQIASVRGIRVPVNHRGDWLFVEVHTDTGLVGLGEASQSGDDGRVLAVLAAQSAALAGKDPTQIHRLRGQLASAGGGRAYGTAVSGIEHALWDILGQQLGVSIRQLMGGAVALAPIRLYANINRGVVDRTPAGFVAAAKAATNAGFTALKLAPFDEVRGAVRVRTGAHAAWRKGVARVAAVREAIGPGVELAVDCHERFDVSEALAAARAMAPLDLLWLEEAVGRDRMDDLAEITRVVPMATAGGENLLSLEACKPLFMRRVVEVVMPDVKHDGGLAETRSIGEASRLQGLRFSPHNPAGPVATVASGQVMSTCANAYLLEFPFGEVPWRADVLIPPEPVNDGYLTLNDEPGLGHRLNQELIGSL